MNKINFTGIVNNDCRDTAVHYRNELIRLGLPKDTMKYGVFKNAKGETHIVLFVDVTKQLFKHDLWHLKKITPGLGNVFAYTGDQE